MKNEDSEEEKDKDENPQLNKQNNQIDKEKKMS
jgi:hypothetical protein